MKSLAIVLGTRPEIIKLAPIILALRENRHFAPRVIFSGQHDSMAEQVFSAFGFLPDTRLNLMRANQTPNSLLGLLLPALEQTLLEIPPSGVLVQGDTSTALGAAVCAFHLKIPVAHIEAGLRTGDPLSPFPEEMNRVLISRLASLHFCHTTTADSNLEREGISSGRYVVGNTVIDALLWIQDKLNRAAIALQPDVAALNLKAKKILLVTGHRRENFDLPIRNLCRTLIKLAAEIPDLEIVYPVHLNPNVQQTVHAELAKVGRIHLIPPVDYPSFVALMSASALIITDSGGVQEEAPTLGKRVLVTRTNTERPEAVELGCSEVFPLDKPDALFERAIKLLAQPAAEQKVMANPYGDGTAAKKIISLLEQVWG